MNAVDNFVAPGLKPSYGFSEAFSPKTIGLNGPRDVSKGVEHVSSSDAKLLESALKRKEGLFANVFPCRGFHKNDAFVALAAERGHAFEIPFSYFLRCNGYKRAALFYRARKFVGKLVKRRVEYRLTSHARDESELRSPRDLIAFGVCLGLSEEQARHALRDLK